MPFKSLQPDIDLPRDVTIWKWFFDSPSSPISRFPTKDLKGYRNCQTNERLNYQEVKQNTIWLSTALTKKFGMKAGDTAALFSPNTIWYPVAMFGVLRLGGTVSGASPAYNVEEMTYALKTASANFLFTVPGSMKVAAAAAMNAGIAKENVFLLEGELDGFTTMRELLEMGKAFGEGGQVSPYKFPSGKQNSDVCAFLSFSSGTTGLPKAVMISHQNAIAQCLQVLPITPKTHRRVLAVLPFFHITGLVHILQLPIVLNAEVYMLPSFTLPSMLEVISKHKIEELLLVPPIIILLVRSPIVEKYDLSCVKRFSSGAAPVSEEILQQLKARFPGTGFKQGYGMTESCSCITAHPPDKYDFKYAHAVGAVCASTSIKIINEDGKELGVNQPGELLAKGPQITMGYLNNEKATKDTYLPDGYLRTGDQAMINEEGLVTITDRIKEMIKVKGIAVAPAELEDLLLGHEHVEDCAILGISDDFAGERPKAFVVAKKAAPAQQELGKSLLQYVTEKKVRHKWLKEVEFVDTIPKSASGKILRRVLKTGGNTGMVIREEERRTSKL